MYIAEVKERISEVDLRAIFLFIVLPNSLHKTSILKHHSLYNIHGIFYELKILSIVINCILVTFSRCLFKVYIICTSIGQWWSNATIDICWWSNFLQWWLQVPLHPWNSRGLIKYDYSAINVVGWHKLLFQEHIDV